MKELRHIALWLLALAALYSCAKSEECPVREDKGGRISWDTGVLETKVYPAGTSVYSVSNSFGSFALLYTGTSESDWNTATYTSYIAGLQVRYFGAGTPTWSTLNEYYWPSGENKRLHFASYSPYQSLHNKAIYGGKDRGIVIPNYSIPADKKDQLYTKGSDGLIFYDDDLMVSNEADLDCATMQQRDTTTYAFHGVPTLFSHIMTRIHFQVVQDASRNVSYYDSQTISIRGIRLHNFYTRGSYRAIAASPGAHWSGQSAPADTAVLYDSHVGTAAISTDDSAPTTVVENYLALPQTITDGLQELLISYRITSTVGGYLFTEDITEKAYLYAAGKDWETNTDLTYKITLSAMRTEPILFTATCEPWVDGLEFHLTPDND